MSRTRDDEIEARHRETMRELATLIDVAINGGAKGRDRKTGFCLLMFDFGDDDDKRMNYISNAQRPDMIVAFKELLARWEGQAEPPAGRA